MDNYPFYQRRLRGSKKHESGDITVSRVLRNRSDAHIPRVAQGQGRRYTTGHGEKPYEADRPEASHRRGHGMNQRASEVLMPKAKATKISNMDVVQEYGKNIRHYGKQPEQLRLSLQPRNLHPLKNVDPESFRRKSQKKAQQKPNNTIVTSGSPRPNSPQKKLAPAADLAPAVAASTSLSAIVPPTGIRNFKHKLKFAQGGTNANSQDDIRELPRAPTTKMMEIQLSYVMARQHETGVMLSLQMDAIRDSLTAELENLSPHRGDALTPHAIRQIFSMCEYFKVSDPVKYAAVEIYDRFMMAFSVFMADELIPLDKQTTMESHQRVKLQAQLRLATCIQLASKITADATCDPLSSTTLHNALNYQPFTVKAVSAAELRALALVKFKLHYITTMDIIEIILVQLELEIPVYRRVYELCAYLVDYILEDHEEVYSCLFKLEHDKNPSLNRVGFRKTEFNKLIEASGVVACCIYAFKQTDYKIYLFAISSLTKVDESTFTDLAAILLRNTSDHELWSLAN